MKSSKSCQLSLLMRSRTGSSAVGRKTRSCGVFVRRSMIRPRSTTLQWGWSLLAGILVASPERQREGHAGLGQYQRLPGLDQQLAGLGEDSRAGEDLAALTPNGPTDHDAESVAGTGAC